MLMFTKLELEGLIRKSIKVNSTIKYYKCYVRILISWEYRMGDSEGGEEVESVGSRVQEIIHKGDAWSSF